MAVKLTKDKVRDDMIMLYKKRLVSRGDYAGIYRH